MPRIVVLDSYTADQGDNDRWRELAALGELSCHPRSDRDQARTALAGAECVLSNKVPIDRELMESAPDLRYIGVVATGFDIIDMDVARDRGIAVSNVPAYSTDSVAQLVFALLLRYFVDVAGHDARVRAGEWSRSSDFCFFTKPLQELAGKQLVVLGMGAIGGAVATIARGFGMRVAAAQLPGREPSEEREPLEQLLPRADVISLHCPLTEQTAGLVDRDFLDRCRPEAVLVNTGRGGLIDEAALRVALDTGAIAAALLDVLGDEPPPPDHPLIGHPRVVQTPHIGWGTVQARTRLIAEASENLAAFLRGERRNRVD